jgi:hypothetical protein
MQACCLTVINPPSWSSLEEFSGRKLATKTRNQEAAQEAAQEAVNG